MESCLSEDFREQHWWIMDKTEFPYDEIISFCKEKAPHEACGVVSIVKGRYRWIPCTNVHHIPTEHFSISPIEYANAEDGGEVVAVVHSHPSSSASPSQADIESWKSDNVDWLIIGLENETPQTHWLRAAQEKKPLYGRKYVWGVNDCFSFLRDFYDQELDIKLNDFYRPEKFWEQGLELFLDNYLNEGFTTVEMKDLAYGDAVLMAIGTNISCHVAVYVGDNKIAHHLNGRLSCVDVYGQFYRDRTTLIGRHKDLL